MKSAYMVRAIIWYLVCCGRNGFGRVSLSIRVTTLIITRGVTRRRSVLRARVMKPLVGGDWVIGVVGVLQFEILAERVRTEYNVTACSEPTELYTARWVEGDEPMMVKNFLESNRPAMAEDHDGSPVFLARNAWHMSKAEEDWPNLRFRSTKEQAL